ncbi:hypothetical protein AAEX28_07165 [Lentisphaerota bacterium WC36G]|nr:hypothetical protein LJT99_10030 [Lentisphaerae bacterium WC36]
MTQNVKTKRQRLKKRSVPKYGEIWQCKECGKKNLKVVYTKHEKNGIYRRRQCSCGNTFETFEKFV